MTGRPCYGCGVDIRNGPWTYWHSEGPLCTDCLSRKGGSRKICPECSPVANVQLTTLKFDGRFVWFCNECRYEELIGLDKKE